MDLIKLREQLLQPAQPRKIKNSRFLSLPTEIRLEIYSYLFSREIQIIINRSTHKHKAAASATGTSILRACRSIHEEAAGVLYGDNTFNLSDCGRLGLMIWLDRIGEDNAARLNHVHITHSQEFSLPDRPFQTACARIDVALSLRLPKIRTYNATIENEPKLTLDDGQRQRKLEMHVELLEKARDDERPFTIGEWTRLVDTVCCDRQIMQISRRTYVASIEEKKYK